jgi:hypothetical protein
VLCVVSLVVCRVSWSPLTDSCVAHR